MTAGNWSSGPSLLVKMSKILLHKDLVMGSFFLSEKKLKTVCIHKEGKQHTFIVLPLDYVKSPALCHNIV